MVSKIPLDPYKTDAETETVSGPTLSKQPPSRNTSTLVINLCNFYLNTLSLCVCAG